MAIPITEPEVWPVFEARLDLQQSMLLYDYARYGLEIRELLEVNGPYSLRTDAREGSWRMRIRDPYEHVSDLEVVRGRYEEQKQNLLRVARGQFLVYACSAFDFFIANLLIFFYIGGGNDPGLPPRPAGNGFLWDEEMRRAFMTDQRISDIETEQWMMANAGSRALYDRIRLLKQICGIDIKRFSVRGRSGNMLDWNFFEIMRRLRHNVAHTAGRSAVQRDPARKYKPISDQDVLDLEEYLLRLLGWINHQLYEIPIIARQR